MQISKWVKHRHTPGTLADAARRILDSDSKCRDVEKTLRGMYVLEALIRHGGNQQKAAAAIGVNRITVVRVLKSLRLTGADARKIAESLQGGKDAAANS